MRTAFVELFYFFIINARASAFGAFLLVLLFVTHFVEMPLISRYDFIFLSAIVYQVVALVFKFEKLKEFFVIFLFHITATVMELFKTHSAIGSWSYPEVSDAFFVLATVPLFTGFLYSAVGSYISRATLLMKLSYENFPAYLHLWTLSMLIYVNFFAHHFVYDVRYFILVYILFIFYKTKIYFTVYQKRRHMPFLMAGVFTAFFIWIAENAGTFTKVWLYPTQSSAWHIVSFEKIGSWFLLLILSFALVSLIYRDRLVQTSQSST